MTRTNASTLSGLSGAISRKAASPVYPQVGHVFCNIPPTDAVAQPDDNALLVEVTDLCRAMSSSLNTLQLKAQPIYRNSTMEPINLYHKVLSPWINSLMHWIDHIELCTLHKLYLKIRIKLLYYYN